MVVKSVSGGSVEKTFRLNSDVWNIDLGGRLPNTDWLKEQVRTPLFPTA